MTPMAQMNTTAEDLLRERVAILEKMGAKRFVLDGANAIDAEEGEWIGTDEHAWHVPSLATMDTKYWKQVQRDLTWSLEHAAESAVVDNPHTCN